MTFKATPRPQFSIEQCNAVFEAVLLDDVIDEHTKIPQSIHLEYQQQELTDCFYICRQVWELGVNRQSFDTLIQKLYKNRAFTKEEQLIYKHVRAKFKQLRFAYKNFDERHQYPKKFDAVTVLMGHLQDDFKNGLRTAVGWRSLLLPSLSHTFSIWLID